MSQMFEKLTLAVNENNLNKFIDADVLLKITLVKST